MKKLIVVSLVLLLVALGWGQQSFAEKVPTPRGELRIVDNDPGNWGLITFNVFEHLMDYDRDGKLVPRLATGWRWLDDRTLEVTLRKGVTFHNGEGFDAEIVKLNWDENTRLKQPHIPGSWMNFKPGSRVEIIDMYTVRFVFPEPDGGAMVKLSFMHISNRQFYRDLGWGEKGWCIINGAGPWGTGPYKLVEGISTPKMRSDRVVLEANQDYWDSKRLPQVKRLIFDNTLGQKEAVELVETHEGRVDLVTGLSPLETLRVAESPHAQVVKNRGALVSIFGFFNMLKAGSPWRDIRLRQAVNYAINRADLIRYAAKGNGVIIPALVPRQGFGYDPTLAPYPFDPAKVRQLLREAGYPNGLSLTLIASRDLEVQGTVVSKMLEQSGFRVNLQILDPVTYQHKTHLAYLDQPAESQTWDIALRSFRDRPNFPVLRVYYVFALDGNNDWVVEEMELRHLYEQVMQTVDDERQQKLVRQMERHTHDQAYFLFLYNPIGLYAVNKAVAFVPYVNGFTNLAETSLMDQHWSVRKQKAAVQQ